MSTWNWHTGAGGLVAPAFLVVLSLAGVGWTFPTHLPHWRAVSIMAGWAGTGLLVGSLALMVREPRWSRMLGGLDTMYRWHHRSGVIGYVLLLCHPLALGVAGLTTSFRSAWRAIAPWYGSWPEWLGWVGLLLLMAGLASTFNQHLGYRRWRALHYLAALGIVSGLSHIVAMRGEVGGFLAFIGLAAIALAWRLLAIDRGLSAHLFRVTRVASKAADTIEATLAPCGGAFRVQPGQFVLAAFGDGPTYRGCEEFHPFSVSGIGPGGEFSVGVKALGPCTKRIQTLTPGALVRLQGPFGHLLADNADKPQLWIAGGIGITPFMAAIRRGKLPRTTTLIYLFRHERDAAFLDELKALAHVESGFELIAQASGESLPDVPAVLSKVACLAQRQVQICGPEGLVQAVTVRLHELGLPARSIHYERFDFR